MRRHQTQEGGSLSALAGGGLLQRQAGEELEDVADPAGWKESYEREVCGGLVAPRNTDLIPRWSLISLARKGPAMAATRCVPSTTETLRVLWFLPTLAAT